MLAAGLAACGSDEEKKGDPIPQQAAADIESRLAEVERRMDAGDGACDDIQNDTKPAVDQIIASLPSGVDPDVRDALQESTDHLFDLTEQECDTEKGQTTETAPAPEPQPEPETETTETTPPPETETTPPETDTGEQTTPGQDGELPPGQGGVNPGNGNSGGNGSGGGTFIPGEG